MKVLCAAVLVAGCTIETGYEPPPPPPWGAPVVGGTMTVTRDDQRLVIADPDRDRVVTVDIASEQVLGTIALEAGSQPGRVIDDSAGRVHVALRGAGQLLTITGDTLSYRPVCGEPRGVAWDATGDVVHVACATGELVTLPAGGGDPIRVLRVGRDLRDVIVREHGLAVTTFRSAEVIEIDAQGVVGVRRALPTIKRGSDAFGTFAQDAVASVAWRSIVLSDGRVLMSHQRRTAASLTTQPGGYGGICSTPVESAVSIIGINGAITAVAPRTDSLPVDAAQNPATGEIAIVSAGNNSVSVFAASSIDTGDAGECHPQSAPHHVEAGDHQPTSVAYTKTGTRFVFYPGPGTVTKISRDGTRSISIAEVAHDEGRDLFHMQTNVGFACASCHPEARDDGAVWTFEELGPRRTQNVSGGVLGRAPFHWSGDMKTISMLIDDVFVDRMAAGVATDSQKLTLAQWLHRIPAPRGVIVDAAAVERGKEMFFDSAQGCASCHNGDVMTNNQLVNVGTGGTLKVPSLVGVGARAPFLHDGCAATLRDRFDSCGGGDLHGHTSHLSEPELADLIAYLESL